MELILLLLILFSLLWLLYTTYSELQHLREAATVAITAARSAVESGHNLRKDLLHASHAGVRHEAHVHCRINRDWSRASASKQGRGAGLKISHLGQAFPNLSAQDMFKANGLHLSRDRDGLDACINQANAAIKLYSVSLSTLPGLLLSSWFQPIAYITFSSLANQIRRPKRQSKQTTRNRGNS
jgi:hypothetical protein